MSQLVKRRALRLGYVVLVSLIALVIARAWPETTPQLPAQENGSYAVTEIQDGDTITIDRDGKTERVRLIGVDTPETKDPRKPVQCFGREASTHTKSLLEGRRVRIEFDPVVGERDRYNRLLAYVWRDDGVFVNKDLLTEGYAHEYTYQNQLYKYRDEFRGAEVNASSAQKGLWSPDTCGGITK